MLHKIQQPFLLNTCSVETYLNTPFLPRCRRGKKYRKCYFSSLSYLNKYSACIMNQFWPLLTSLVTRRTSSMKRNYFFSVTLTHNLADKHAKKQSEHCCSGPLWNQIRQQCISKVYVLTRPQSEILDHKIRTGISHSALIDEIGWNIAIWKPWTHGTSCPEGSNLTYYFFFGT